MKFIISFGALPRWRAYLFSVTPRYTVVGFGTFPSHSATGCILPARRSSQILSASILRCSCLFTTGLHFSLKSETCWMARSILPSLAWILARRPMPAKHMSGLPLLTAMSMPDWTRPMSSCALDFCISKARSAVKICRIPSARCPRRPEISPDI